MTVALPFTSASRLLNLAVAAAYGLALIFALAAPAESNARLSHFAGPRAGAPALHHAPQHLAAIR